MQSREMILARPASRSASRIEFVGRYKGLLAALVVLIHTGITYGAALLGFATRLFFPVGWSIHNQQLGFFPMYILLFAAGIKAGQEGWLEKLATVRLRLWAPLAIVSAVALLPMMVVGGAVENVAPFLGGLTWQSAAYASWEAVVGTSLFITTIVLFARRRWGSGAIARSFGEASYGIYIFHAATIILTAIALWRVNLHPALKWAIVGTAGVCIPWALSEGLKRLPGFSRIL